MVLLEKLNILRWFDLRCSKCGSMVVPRNVGGLVSEGKAGVLYSKKVDCCVCEWNRLTKNFRKTRGD